MMEIEHVRPEDIEKTSFRIIEKEIREMGRELPEDVRHVLLRVIHTTADFEYLDTMAFSEGAAEKAADAFRRGAHVVTDTTMAMSGINKRKLAAFGGQAHCYIADPEVAETARRDGTTRSAAAVDKAVREACLTDFKNLMGFKNLMDLKGLTDLKDQTDLKDLEDLKDQTDLKDLEDLNDLKNLTDIKALMDLKNPTDTKGGRSGSDCEGIEQNPETYVKKEWQKNQKYPLIFAVGNAPTALLALEEKLQEGFRPELIIAVPVGFVNVVPAKERIMAACETAGVPCICNKGRKGGSNVAAAICNAILYRI